MKGFLKKRSVVLVFVLAMMALYVGGGLFVHAESGAGTAQESGTGAVEEKYVSMMFLPLENTVSAEAIMTKDGDGKYWLDIGLRGAAGNERSFFIEGDRCQLKDKDGTSTNFMFERSTGAGKAIFKSDGGEEIEVTSVSETAENIQEMTVLTPDDLAVMLGGNTMRITCGSLTHESNMGVLIESEDGHYDCRGSIKPIPKADATCEHYGYMEDCFFCMLCGNYYENEKQAEIQGEISPQSGFFIEPLGHDFQDVEVITEMTDKHAGLKRVKCSRCGKENEQKIPRKLITITKQPEDREVNFPDGTDFTVEVDHPENVKSYRWELRVDDEAGIKDAVYQLNGSSASEKTLRIPATECDLHPFHFKCYITDIDGELTVSEEGTMTIANPYEAKYVLYVGEYALEAGESADLEDLDLGSGKVTFDANCQDVTLDKVKFQNGGYVFDSNLSTAYGLYLRRCGDAELKDEYRYYFNGNSEITNTFYDPLNNQSGVALNTHLGVMSDPNKPTVLIDGDSPAVIRGGEYCVYTDAELEIAGDIKTETINKNYMNGLRGHTVLIDEGVKADLEVNGCAINAAKGGDLRIFKGAVINIDSTAPFISKGQAVLNIIRAEGGGSVYVNDAEINIKGHAIPENYTPFKRFIAAFNGIGGSGNINLSGADVNIEFDAVAGDRRYANNFVGISSDAGGSLNMADQSSLTVKMDDLAIYLSSGTTMEGHFIAEPGSKVDIDLRTNGRTTGIWADGRFEVEDAGIDLSCVSVSDDPLMDMRGILCNTAKITMNDPRYSIRAKVVRESADGTALDQTKSRAIVAGMGFEYDSNEKLSYDEAYTPELIELLGKAQIEKPAKGKVSTYNFGSDGLYFGRETVYDLSDTSNAATELLIKAPDKPQPLKVTRKNKTYRVKAVKKAKRTYKAVKVKNAKGKVTYKITGSKKSKKALKFTKKTGKITVRKGTKKGTYKLKIKVTAVGGSGYAKGSRTVTVKVRVK